MKSSNIGGQAVLEGIMMKNKDAYAVAVRKPDGEIIVEKATFHSCVGGMTALTKIPFIRGVFNIQYIPTLPISVVPFIFAGVCLSFGCAGPLYAGAGQSVLGLFVTFMIACVCLWLCAFGQEKLMKKYPLEES